MQTLRPSCVPEYLKTSCFYLGLNVTDDDEFLIPLNHMKLDTNVDTLADMTELLNTIRYWGSGIIPQAMFEFAALQPFGNVQLILEPYRTDLQFICAVCSIASEVLEESTRLEKAMTTGNLGAVQYFHKNKEPFSLRAIAMAAGKGALDCLQYALSFEVDIHRFQHIRVFYEAVRNGQVDCIAFLHQKGFKLKSYPRHIFHNYEDTEVLAQIAASSGQCDVLKYLHSQKCSIWSTAILAADAGHYECLEFAIQNGARLRGESYGNDGGSLAQRLARANQLKLFPLALSRGSTIDEQTALNFAKCENLDCFQLCIQHMVRPSMSFVIVVIEKGYLACLEYLHQFCASKVEGSADGSNWLTYVTSISSELVDVALIAVCKKQWECLRYLITHNCPMNSVLTAYLVELGQLELYHLAVAHGCKVSVQAAYKFARDGNLPLLQHALEHGCERSEEILRAAARHGQLQCLKYAHAQGCPCSAQVSLAAARGGHLECLQYLHEHGCPWDARVRSLKRKHYCL